MLDRALCICWYNLPEQSREAYLSWFHESYIPKLLQQPGVLWAAHYASAKVPPHALLRFTNDNSIPVGTDHILLVGANSSHSFAKDVRMFADGVPRKPDADLPQEDRKMLSLRIGKRTNIMIEEARVDGPEANQRETGVALSPCIQLGSFNATSPEVEEELLAWYAGSRMPSMRKLSGCLGMRKLVSVAGWAKHAVLHEFVSLEARTKHGVLHKLEGRRERGDWENRLIPKLIHEPGSPNVAFRIWPPVKLD
ncbi:MAG: hypothetical protein A3G24_18210 [Betaproteobacteria bacterium RIFCSPLOWO2_12_FULL_62_13]|nr:MAG: hypothetical protein A3G24_18210 [Betaproteobacteria bacterium RIFCSPLOWO2_12_FULL_62_13]